MATKRARKRPQDDPRCRKCRQAGLSLREAARAGCPTCTRRLPSPRSVPATSPPPGSYVSLQYGDGPDRREYLHLVGVRQRRDVAAADFDAEIRASVEHLRSLGCSWTTIGRALLVTGEAARKRYGS